MRIQQLREATRYPATISATEIMDYIRKINRQPADFERDAGAGEKTHTAYMKKHIGKNNRFVLTRVRVNDYDTDMYADQDLVDKYYKMFTAGEMNYPPIVVSDKGRVIDGAHRLAALDWAGVDTVWAYKPESVQGEKQ